MTADGLSGAIKFASFEISKIFLEKRLPVSFHPALQVRDPLFYLFFHRKLFIFEVEPLNATSR